MPTSSPPPAHGQSPAAGRTSGMTATNSTSSTSPSPERHDHRPCLLSHRHNHWRQSGRDVPGIVGPHIDVCRSGRSAGRGDDARSPHRQSERDDRRQHGRRYRRRNGSNWVRIPETLSQAIILPTAWHGQPSAWFPISYCRLQSSAALPFHRQKHHPRTTATFNNVSVTANIASPGNYRRVARENKRRNGLSRRYSLHRFKQQRQAGCRRTIRLSQLRREPIPSPMFPRVRRSSARYCRRANADDSHRRREFRHCHRHGALSNQNFVDTVNSAVSGGRSD